MTIAEIGDISPTVRVLGREVKLIVCNDPKGILSDSKQFMVGVSTMPSGLKTPSHAHEAEELYVILEGTGEALQGTERKKFKKGSVIFNPSNEEHGIVSVDDTITLLWILVPGGKYPH